MVASRSSLSRHSWNGWSVCTTPNRKGNPDWSSSCTIFRASTATSSSTSCTAKTEALNNTAMKHSCVWNWANSKSNSTTAWTFSHAFGRLPQSLLFAEGGKRFLPHFLDRPEHQTYVGPLPNKHYYEPDGRSQKRRDTFSRWYDSYHPQASCILKKIQFCEQGQTYKKEGLDPHKGCNQLYLEKMEQKRKADFTIGNIYFIYQYFGRHCLPSSGSYVRSWKSKTVPFVILLKEIYIPNCKISLAVFVPYPQAGLSEIRGRFPNGVRVWYRKNITITSSSFACFWH